MIWYPNRFIMQACLGEVKKDKGSEPVHLFAKVDDKKFVIGILSSEKFPQISFDLVFEKEFELSHNWKNGSVYFTGYRSSISNGYPFVNSFEFVNVCHVFFEICVLCCLNCLCLFFPWLHLSCRPSHLVSNCLSFFSYSTVVLVVLFTLQPLRVISSEH